MNMALWVGQVLLAAAFGMAGYMKLTQPMAMLIEKMVWPEAMSEGMVRFIGLSELLGAIGLILPAATCIKPVLTAWAGIGLAVVMVLAGGFHVTRGEFSALPINAVLGALAAFVAWGRFKKSPIAPKVK